MISFIIYLDDLLSTIFDSVKPFKSNVVGLLVFSPLLFPKTCSFPDEWHYTLIDCVIILNIESFFAYNPVEEHGLLFYEKIYI